MNTRMTCTKRWWDFPFAHRQPSHEGHCRLIHGHNWGFEVTFLARELDHCGFVVDFGSLKPVKEWLTDRFDHTLVLNGDDPVLSDQLFHSCLGGLAKLVKVPDCSSEGLAAYVAHEVDQLVRGMTMGRVTVLRVTVWEDGRNSATWEVAP